jgi:hypothetical protein
VIIILEQSAREPRPADTEGFTLAWSEAQLNLNAPPPLDMEGILFCRYIFLHISVLHEMCGFAAVFRCY